MEEVTIYTKKGCPFCVRAKDLLDSKNVSYNEVDVGNDPDKRSALTKKSNGKATVPQIFIGKKHIGGCDDLFSLNDSGNLDDLLK
ncbi:MAG: glutaredoxin 3 [Alphaproteobacteria bacterium]|nr:glutaredoxin 3 [Alphaproteobacteria bacterium]